MSIRFLVVILSVGGLFLVAACGDDPGVKPAGFHVVITEPADGFTTGAFTIEVKGKAGALAGRSITNVQLRVNSGEFRDVEGTTDWVLRNVTLVKGQNTLQARAFADDGAVTNSAQLSVHNSVSGGGNTYNITFWYTNALPHVTAVLLCGDAPALGGWSLENAPQMSEAPANAWSVTVALNDGFYQYKYVVIQSGGTNATNWLDMEPNAGRIAPPPTEFVDDGTGGGAKNAKLKVGDGGEVIDDEKDVVPIVAPASSRSGMGAIPYAGGVTFRVWAPNAEAVSVAGDFNIWKTRRNPLASEGNGYWSVDVTNAVADQGYKYVITYQSNKIWRNDPYAREVSNSVGHSIIKDRDYTWTNPGPANWHGWHEMVIYELHVKTWVANVAGPGTLFAKVAQKADYLKDSLAINAVKIMPVAEFPGDYSWGYNPSHLFAPESSYGGYLAFKQMVDVLHSKEIAVIMDVVHNHYGPSDLDLWCFDGPSYGGGGIYFFTDWRQGTPWGDTRPDYGRGEVRQFIRDNAIYWLEEMGCDGLRWDATVYIRKRAYDQGEIDEGRTLLRWINEEVNSIKPGAIMIAEDLNDDNGWMTSFDSGGCGFDSQWHAKFIHPIRDEMKKTSDNDRNMNVIKSCIDWINNGDHTRLVKYSESHDECSGKNGKQRLIEDIWPGNARSYYSMKRASLALLTAIFSPGIPMIFQGQDNLEWGNWDDSVNFSWADVDKFSAAGTNYIAMIGDAVRLKRNWGGLTAGFGGNGVNVFHVNNTGKVVAFHRWMNHGANDDVVVIINFSNTRFDSYNLNGMPYDGGWTLRYNSDWKGTYVDWEKKFGSPNPYPGAVNSGNGTSSGGTMPIEIGPYTVLVYSRD